MLEIERLPSFISPSALMQSETQPNTFYISRLMADRDPREPQSLAASVGSAFDYYIKVELMAEKFKHKSSLLPGLKNGIEGNNLEAHQAGKRALTFYKMGAYNIDEIHDVEIHTNGSVNGVPLYGMLDASTFDEEYDLEVPFDWKVSGYTSKSGISPKQGYYRLWDDNRPKGAHKNYYKEMPFEIIDPKWALQLCTYGWITGIPLGTPFPAYIDMLCWRKGKVRTAKYRGIITEQFQMEIARKYERLWRELNDGSFIDRLDSKSDLEFVWHASTKESWF
jgi:hypothetical protein